MASQISPIVFCLSWLQKYLFHSEYSVQLKQWFDKGQSSSGSLTNSFLFSKKDISLPIWLSKLNYSLRISKANGQSYHSKAQFLRILKAASLILKSKLTTKEINLLYTLSSIINFLPRSILATLTSILPTIHLTLISCSRSA